MGHGWSHEDKVTAFDVQGGKNDPPRGGGSPKIWFFLRKKGTFLFQGSTRRKEEGEKQ